jgi:pimeloyl-ACP methyl ester carboxylesterase
MNPSMGEIRERREQVAGLDTHWLEADPPADAAPTLYVHGVPNSGELWEPFLERTGGAALDLPGFGRSDKPADFDYSIPGYDRFLGAFVDHVGFERFSLVVHDWGVVGLATAQRLSERVERVVVFVTVPLFDDYRWHRIARIWRTPLAGELFMGFGSRWGFRQISREANFIPGPMPDEFIDTIWRYFDHGTQRAILKLYRASPPELLGRHGERLGDIAAPALVLWPEQDPYIAREYGERYAQALGNATLERVEDCGHWMWLDRPDLIERAGSFLTS